MGSKGLALAFVAIILIGILLTDVPRLHAFTGEDFTITSDQTAPPIPTQPKSNDTVTITITNNSTGSIPDVGPITLTSNSTVTTNCSLTPASHSNILGGQNANSTLSCKPSVATHRFVINVTATDTAIGSGRVHSVFVPFVFDNLVNLDANSVSPIDATVAPSASQAKTFNIGAVVNASSNPINSVFGWEFQINYNGSAFTPQADPSAFSSYPDGPGITVTFGSQTTAGTVNWAGLIAANKAFPVITYTPPPPLGGTGSVLIAVSIIAPNPPVTISANNLLANVAFELNSKPSTNQVFTVSTVIFTDQGGALLPVSYGADAVETVTNAPPVTRFSVQLLPAGDPSCASITGSLCSQYAFKFDGTPSSDSEDGTITKSEYFWDFGDQTQDSVNAGTAGCATGILNCTQGAIAIHDYGSAYATNGPYTVSLRVVDSIGATGTARDDSGIVISNSQPSHMSATASNVNGFSVTANVGVMPIGPGDNGPIGSSLITLTSVAPGFTGEISLSYSISPNVSDPPSVSFNPSLVNLPAGGRAFSNVTISVGTSTPVRGYNITISGAYGPIINNATIMIIPVTMSVQPPRVISPGNTFTVNIKTTAADLLSWQFQLNYNQTFLQAGLTSVTYGSYWAQAASQNQAILIRQVNQTRGTILVGGTLFSGYPLFNGTGILASVTFTAYGTGVTTLALSHVIMIEGVYQLQRGQLVEVAVPLHFEQSNGVFCNNTSCPEHYVAISKLATSVTSTGPGTPVTVSAAVTNRGLNPENVTVAVQAGTSTIGSKQIILNPGNSTVLTVQWNTTGFPAGPYTIKATITVNGATNQNPNDSASQTVTLNAESPGIPITYIIAAVAAVALAAVLATILIMRRRRAMSPRTSPTTKAPPSRLSPGKG